MRRTRFLCGLQQVKSSRVKKKGMFETVDRVSFHREIVQNLKKTKFRVAGAGTAEVGKVQLC